MTASRASPLRTSLGFVALALLCLAFADLEITSLNPWDDLYRFGVGLVTPDFSQGSYLLSALAYTVAFGILGTVLAAVAGLALAQIYHFRAVRVGAAFIRAIHELFWALLFLQIFGLTPITGLFAIAVPYTGVFAKVYSEILEEADDAAARALPAGASRASVFLFARLPDAWAAMKSYTYYRFECGLRSSAILGFVGLPTVGFFLESAFSDGHYSQAAAYLLVLYALIASLRVWLPSKLVLPAAVICGFILPAGDFASWSSVVSFFTHDIVPAPLRDGVDVASLATFSDWLWTLLVEQALPGVINTILITQITLVTTGMLALLLFPLISRKFFGWIGVGSGHVLLVVLRSTPEFILAYILLQLLGPSMLPAVVALTLHNGAVIGFLIGRKAERMPLRPDAPRGLNLYGYEVLPRVYGQFLAFLFYRWEIIMRETAVLGILGVHTLGFFVDSAMAMIHIDVALILLLITAALNMGIDATSRRLRTRLRLPSGPPC